MQWSLDFVFTQEFQYDDFNRSRSRKQVVVFLHQTERASLGQPDDEERASARGDINELDG